MPSITLSKTEKQSKGRNGWFYPARVRVLHGPHDMVGVEVWSKNESGQPPIDLYLTQADAGKLAKALLLMIDIDVPYDGCPCDGGCCERCKAVRCALALAEVSI